MMKDYNISELLEYRATHTLKETAEYYETTPNYINNLCFKSRGFRRDEKYFTYCRKHTIEQIMEKYGIVKKAAARDRGIAILKNIKPQEVFDYFCTHNARLTSEHFGISMNSVYLILRSNGFETPRHKNYDNFDVEEFREYAKDHTQKEIAAHFKLNAGLVRWYVEKYDCNYRKKNYLKFKTSGKNVYILTKGNEELCFPRAEDIAKYFDRTKTHVQVLINETGEIFGYKVRKIRMIYYIE